MKLDEVINRPFRFDYVTKPVSELQPGDHLAACKGKNINAICVVVSTWEHAHDWSVKAHLEDEDDVFTLWLPLDAVATVRVER